ncbi:pinin-like [Paramacrobiotus metropolitanus]|uniref:pinin-like n=1 Tax=Paramacrobiotus metropolitanus TaxID=2943436 RepID=UPI0024463AFA|nr:pinin-like [Paramacrobiotus metropolitanus]
MTAEVISSVSSLTEQLQEAKDKLRETEESIKRVTGRDVVDPHLVARRPDAAVPPASLRPPITVRTPSFIAANPNFARPTDEPPTKRPRAVTSFRPIVAPDNTVPGSQPERRRVTGGWDDDSDEYRRRKIQSTVFFDTTPRKTREERMSEANIHGGDKDAARNRRMFGSLKKTLEKFQIEQENRKKTDEQQKEIRQKLEEKEAAEKRESQRERRELFWERKRSQAVVKFLETKVDIMKRFTDWETSQKPLMKFLRTESTCPIYYQPKILNPAQEEKLAKHRAALQAEIEKRRDMMQEQLNRLDGKIEKASQKRGQDVTLEEHIQETKRTIREEPLDDYDVDEILDDKEVEGYDLVEADEPGPEKMATDDSKHSHVEMGNVENPPGDDGASSGNKAEPRPSTGPAIPGENADNGTGVTDVLSAGVY